MGFEVIEDLATADRLSEARLLWYGLPDPSVHGGYVAAPWPTDIASPSHMQKTWGGYSFLVLLED